MLTSRHHAAEDLVRGESCELELSAPPVRASMTLGRVVLCAAGGVVLWACVRGLSRRQRKEEPTPLLDCIRGRRSVFPKSFVPGSVVPPATVHRLLEAAMWAPFHGPVPPWRFVVLGRKGMVQMQEMTLAFYDEHWREVGWANGKRGSEDEYLAWRRMTEGEITGRWGPVSYMLAIIMRRQAGSKRMPEWEEAAATACAVQNMHIQASAHSGLACYWSSWHAAARDSDAMRAFLGMGEEDRCLGFFIVARCEPNLGDQRSRTAGRHLCVEWRD